MKDQPIIKQSSFHSIPRQADRLNERHESEPAEIECCGLKITVAPGVYQTSGDSELMAKSVKITKAENFLEIGCGTGVVSLALAKRANQGVGVDINIKAVENSKLNARKQKIANVEFFQSDVFKEVKGEFDVIICNPPYTGHEIKDDIDRMFWDPEDKMKREFFRGAKAHLKPGGRIYFGWANFADIDVDLPFKLAEASGYELVNTYSQPHPRGEFTFLDC